MNDNTFEQKQPFIDRLETVRKLDETDTESYTIVKDRETGQHYLWYSLFHLNLSEGGRRDFYEHFLPLASDDVLGLVVGEDPFRFPEHWKRPYLRSGTDERLMWFDPSENFDLQEAAEEERLLFDRLMQFKEQWEQATDKEELTKQFFSDLEEQKRKK